MVLQEIGLLSLLPRIRFARHSVSATIVMDLNHGSYVYISGGHDAPDAIPVRTVSYAVVMLSDFVPSKNQSASNVSYLDAVSETFKPGNIFGGMFSDMAITSSDYTVYYVHRQHLASVSTNSFAGLLTNASFSTSILETAPVFNVVIHTIYDMSCTHYNPPLANIEAAFNALVKYGVSPLLYASPSQPLYPLLMLHAPYRPIEAYAVAAKWGFEDAAVAISAHLLAFDLSCITDELSIKMGPIYLRRLMDLHFNRTRALKTIVLQPPRTHLPTLVCSEGLQAQLTTGWAFAAAELAWATLPGTCNPSPVFQRRE